MAARLLEFLMTNQFNGGKPGQPYFQPQVAHFTANQPALLTFMTARSWVIFKLFGVKERDLAWLYVSPLLWLNNMEYIYLERLVCGMQTINDTVGCAVQDVQEYTHISWGQGDWNDVIHSTNHRFTVALWHSYTRTILMQYRLVIILSLLMCDKQHLYFVLLILHNPKHKLSESVWWSVLGVNTLPPTLKGLISISAMTFICEVWCTHNYLQNEVCHSYVAQNWFFFIKGNLAYRGAPRKAPCATLKSVEKI